MDTSHAAVTDRLNAFREKCAGLGLALTPQRLSIYQLLAGDDTHPTAEDIYRRLKPGMPSLSLGTVYRTLEVFEQNGLVSRIHTLGDQARFEANLEPHHHLVCVRCRRVTDYQDARLDQIPLQPKALGGFRVLTHHVHLFGVCAACQGSA